jgi:hypothetical protein
MDFYRTMAAKGLYVNAPGPYFLDGTHKDGMGYDEMQWSRPRWEWITQARQQIYDQTYHKIASMGWMFCPIEQVRDVVVRAVCGGEGCGGEWW